MNYSFKQLRALTDQCADVIDVICNFSSLVHCSGKHVSRFASECPIFNLQTDRNGVIYSRSFMNSYDLPLSDDPIDRIWPLKPCRFRLFEQIEKLADDCEKPTEPGKDYLYSLNPSSDAPIFAFDFSLQEIYIFDINQQYTGYFNANLQHHKMKSCIFVKNRFFVIYEVEWSDRSIETIKWEIHMFDCCGRYLGLFCHGPRDVIEIGELFMAADAYGHVFVSSSEHNKIYKFSSRGLQIGEINVHRPLDIVVSADNELFVISDQLCVEVHDHSNFRLKRSFDIIDLSFSIALLPNGKVVVGGDDHLSVYQ